MANEFAKEHNSKIEFSSFFSERKKEIQGQEISNAHKDTKLKDLAKVEHETTNLVVEKTAHIPTGGAETETESESGTSDSDSSSLGRSPQERKQSPIEFVLEKKSTDMPDITESDGDAD